MKKSIISQLLISTIISGLAVSPALASGITPTITIVNDGGLEPTEPTYTNNVRDIHLNGSSAVVNLPQVNGDNNTVRIGTVENPLSGSGNFVNGSQSGNGNTFLLNATTVGIGNYTTPGAIYNNEINNRSFGDNNYSEMTLNGGATSNTVYHMQEGNDNSMVSVVKALGFGNFLDSYVKGNNNTMRQEQLGSNGYMKVRVIGDDNNTDLIQGGAQRLTFNYTGSGLDLRYDQTTGVGTSSNDGPNHVALNILDSNLTLNLSQTVGIGNVIAVGTDGSIAGRSSQLQGSRTTLNATQTGSNNTLEVDSFEPVWAQNQPAMQSSTISSYTTGSNNRELVMISGTSNNTTSTSVNGNYNTVDSEFYPVTKTTASTISTTITGDNNFVGSYVAGSNSRSNTILNGQSNSAYNLNYGNNSSSLIFITGNRNNAHSVNQFGSAEQGSNTSGTYININGHDNDTNAVINSTELDNQQMLFTVGNGNYLQTSQTGGNNTISAYLTGDNNEAYFTQAGSEDSNLTFKYTGSGASLGFNHVTGVGGAISSSGTIALNIRDKHATLDFKQAGGANNRITVDQGNNASVMGDWNSIKVWQVGNNNTFLMDSDNRVGAGIYRVNNSFITSDVTGGDNLDKALIEGSSGFNTLYAAINNLVIGSRNTLDSYIAGNSTHSRITNTIRGNDNRISSSTSQTSSKVTHTVTGDNNLLNSVALKANASTTASVSGSNNTVNFSALREKDVITSGISGSNNVVTASLSPVGGTGLGQNTARVNASGSNNVINAVVRDNNNSSIGSIIGSNNKLALDQAGVRNTQTAYVSGNNNDVKVLQRVSDNTLSSVISGDNNKIDLRQASTNQKLTLNYTGQYANFTYNQGIGVGSSDASAINDVALNIWDPNLTLNMNQGKGFSNEIAIGSTGNIILAKNSNISVTQTGGSGHNRFYLNKDQAASEVQDLTINSRASGSYTRHTVNVDSSANRNTITSTSGGDYNHMTDSISSSDNSITRTVSGYRNDVSTTIQGISGSNRLTQAVAGSDNTLSVTNNGSNNIMAASIQGGFNTITNVNVGNNNNFNSSIVGSKNTLSISMLGGSNGKERATINGSTNVVSMTSNGSANDQLYSAKGNGNTASIVSNGSNNNQFVTVNGNNNKTNILTTTSSSVGNSLVSGAFITGDANDVTIQEARQGSTFTDIIGSNNKVDLIINANAGQAVADISGNYNTVSHRIDVGDKVYNYVTGNYNNMNTYQNAAGGQIYMNTTGDYNTVMVNQTGGNSRLNVALTGNNNTGSFTQGTAGDNYTFNYTGNNANVSVVR